MKQLFRVEKKESFTVLGYPLHTTNKRSEGKRSIPKHWQNFEEKNAKEILMPLMNQQPYGLFGISVYNTDPLDSRKFDYYIGVSSDEKESNELKTYVVPANTWAIFPCTIDTIGKTEVQAITRFLPRSKYRPLNKGYITGRMKSEAPDITYYGKDSVVEVWVAVKEK